MMDLKGSEKLFRLGAAEGEPNKWVGNCLSHMLSGIISHGGTVIQTDGDGLTAFFDVSTSETPMKEAIRSVEFIQNEFNIIEEFFAEENEDMEISLRFRASASWGEIRPCWQKHGEELRASWEEVGNGNIFVTAARLLEIERKLSNQKTDSNIILTELDAQRALKLIPELKEQTVCNAESFEGKHGHKYVCTAFSLTNSPMTMKKAS